MTVSGRLNERRFSVTKRPGLLNRTVKRLWRGTEGAAPLAQRRDPNLAARPAEPRPATDFSEGLLRLAELDWTREPRLHAVSLAEFRDAVADKWDRLVDKIEMIVDNLTRRHVGKGNEYYRVSEDSFVFVFFGLSADEALRRAAAIAADLERHLVGDGSINGKQPRMPPRDVRLDGVIADDGGVDLDALHAATTRWPTAEGESPRQALRRHLMPSAAATVSTPIHAQHHHRSSVGAAYLPSAEEAHHSSLWRHFNFKRDTDNTALDPWCTVPPISADTRLSLVWRPTWVSDGEAISSYSARVLRTDRGREQVLEGTLAYPGNDLRTAIALDRFVVAAAVRNIVRADVVSGPSIIIPLNWASFTSDRRGDVIAPFADLPHALRQARVKVELFRIPPDVDPGQLDEAVSFLRTIGCDVMVRMRLSSPVIERAAASGASAVGLDLSELKTTERMGDEALLSTLDQMHDAADHHGIGCYLWSARRPRLISNAVLTGLDLVNGPGLMDDVPRPAMVLNVARDRFAAMVQGS